MICCERGWTTAALWFALLSTRCGLEQVDGGLVQLGDAIATRLPRAHDASRLMDDVATFDAMSCYVAARAWPECEALLADVRRRALARTVRNDLDAR